MTAPTPPSKSTRTKRRLADALLVLLQNRPINEITVDDIVTQCEVNRNTFYYHFDNIGELVEFYVKSIVDDLIDTGRTIVKAASVDAEKKYVVDIL